MTEAPAREWILLSPDPAAVHEIRTRHGLSFAAAKVLANRGIVEPAEVERFLHGGLEDLPDPSRLKDVRRAAVRLAEAGFRGEPVLIYADYDADGATGAACLYLVLKEIFPGLPIRIHQNDRRRDGYGLRSNVLASHAREGFRTVVTVDCGITDHDVLQEASHGGIEVIVTDHHLPGETLPEAFAVVNPKRNDCPFPGKELAGVGVAFLLACAVRRVVRESGGFESRAEPTLRRYLDLVALGTVADMSDLRGENRIFVREGLREIRKSPRPGMEALFCAAGGSVSQATEADLGFRIGPRLNAAGRVGDAKRGSKILVSSSREEAWRLARELNEDNALRQREEERIAAAVEAILSAGELPPAIVLSDPAWNAGVLGIVASRISARYARPVVLLQEDGGSAKGSCRSGDGFHIVSALSTLSGLLTRFGGHAQAAGLALPAAHIDAFRREFSGLALRHAEKSPFVLRQRIDAQIHAADITPDLLRDLERLRPFGAGNEEPVFLLRGVQVSSVSPVGAGGRHLRFVVLDVGSCIPGIAFQRNGIPRNREGRTDLLFSVRDNVYRGVHSLQIHMRDARPADCEPVLCEDPPAG